MVLSGKTFHLFIHFIIMMSALYISVKNTQCGFPDKEILVLLISMIITDILTSAVTEVYYPKLYQKKFKYIISPSIKYVFIYFLIMMGIQYVFYFNSYLYYNYIVAILIYIITIFIFYCFTIILYLRSGKDEDNNYEVKKYVQSELDFVDNITENHSIIKHLQKAQTVSGKGIEYILNSAEYNSAQDVAVLSDRSMIKKISGKVGFFLTDFRINDIHDINLFFSEVYERMKSGGFAVFVFEELNDFEDKYFSKTHGIRKRFKLLHYYFYYRAFPKIPVLLMLHRIISRGKNKVISKAEMWGRLVYSGYDVLNIFSDGQLTYVMTQKKYLPSTNPNPSFYPVIFLNRVGLHGKIIKIHKIRSMYPYSEFIQKKLFENNNLNSIGKIKDDFRITKPGKIFRKFWIDELPQFYDWLRGEIKLVGIRALSQHFFSLYPQEYKNLFLQVKPGIISPIFDEETDGFSDIVRIEQAYLESYLREPIRTDIKYFFLTIKQIISGVRSK